MNISDEEYIEYGDEEYKKFKEIFEKKTYLMFLNNYQKMMLKNLIP